MEYISGKFGGVFLVLVYKNSAGQRLRRLSFAHKVNCSILEKKALIDSLKLMEVSDQYNFCHRQSFRT